MIEIETPEDRAVIAATVRIVCACVAVGVLAVGWGIAVIVGYIDERKIEGFRNDSR